MQNQRGRDLVDDAAVLLAGVAGLVEDLVGFARGEAFVPKVDGQAGECTKLGGEGLRLGRLRAGLAGEVDRVANHNAHNTEALGKPCKGAEVFSGNAGRSAFPPECQHRLGCEAELIGHSNPDAAVADVKTEIAGDGGGFQRVAPG